MGTPIGQNFQKSSSHTESSIECPLVGMGVQVFSSGWSNGFGYGLVCGTKM